MLIDIRQTDLNKNVSGKNDKKNLETCGVALGAASEPCGLIVTAEIKRSHQWIVSPSAYLDLTLRDLERSYSRSLIFQALRISESRERLLLLKAHMDTGCQTVPLDLKRTFKSFKHDLLIFQAAPLD